MEEKKKGKLPSLVNPKELFILYIEMDSDSMFHSLSSFSCERSQLDKQFGPTLLYFCHGFVPSNLQGMVPGNPVAQTHADLGVNNWKTLLVRIRLDSDISAYRAFYSFLSSKILAPVKKGAADLSFHVTLGWVVVGFGVFFWSCVHVVTRKKQWRPPFVSFLSCNFH